MLGEEKVFLSTFHRCFRRNFNPVYFQMVSGGPDSHTQQLVKGPVIKSIFNHRVEQVIHVRVRSFPEKGFWPSWPWCALPRQSLWIGSWRLSDQMRWPLWKANHYWLIHFVRYVGIELLGLLNMPSTKISSTPVVGKKENRFGGCPLSVSGVWLFFCSMSNVLPGVCVCVLPCICVLASVNVRCQDAVPTNWEVA